MRGLLLAVFAMLAIATSAAAEPRVALVIGNSRYGGDLPKLTNPANDAELMASTLKRLGFQVVKVEDADLNQMKRAIADFGDLLASAGPTAVGLFYYAGHGLQISGVNYLIPLKANIQKSTDADLEAVSADLVLKQMEYAGNALNIVILDACRNNPLSRGMRSAGGGLARMDAPMGTFIAYSTAPGETAADGTGKNSPYTLALAKAMQKPGIAIEETFRDARVDVITATNKEQVPWESSSLTGAFYFQPGTQTAGIAAPAVPSAPAAPAQPAAPAAIVPSATSSGQSIGKGCGDQCPEMVTVPGGSFKMGSPDDEADRMRYEGPRKTIRIKSFAIGKFDVTVGQFAAFIKASGYQPTQRCDINGNASLSNGSWDNPGFNQGSKEPVVCVNWNDAEAYAQWLAKATGKPYRLPSEAEWEYAARAGETGAHYWGSGIGGACAYANVADRTAQQEHANWTVADCDDHFALTSPVGALKPNTFGLYDMLGNVKQWGDGCATDSIDDIPADGSPASGTCGDRPVRGSAWNSPPDLVRLARRERAKDTYAAFNYGFRVALGQ
ncbi:MAG TPA: SUMF1/EgtB/PvdO family nonheme iron enzyme [Candidatus Binatia bacterium]|nr:SUMF1/EgtB/PvdO family nonheme iron enzyme [Candidatus Binatia bacterium]